jgi:hypothetical protein
LARCVAQGLTLVPLLHALKLSGADDDADEEAHARRVEAEAGLARLDDVARRVGESAAVRGMRDHYKTRIQRWSVRDRREHREGDSERALPPGDNGAETRTARYRTSAARGSRPSARR